MPCPAGHTGEAHFCEYNLTLRIGHTVRTDKCDSQLGKHSSSPTWMSQSSPLKRRPRLDMLLLLVRPSQSNVPACSGLLSFTARASLCAPPAPALECTLESIRIHHSVEAAALARALVLLPKPRSAVVALSLMPIIRCRRTSCRLPSVEEAQGGPREGGSRSVKVERHNYTGDSASTTRLTLQIDLALWFAYCDTAFVDVILSRAFHGMATTVVNLKEKPKAAEREEALHHEIMLLRSELAEQEEERVASKKAEEEVAQLYKAAIEFNEDILDLQEVVMSIRNLVQNFMTNIQVFQRFLFDCDQPFATPKSCKLGNPLCNLKHADPNLECPVDCWLKFDEMVKCAKGGLIQATLDWKNAMAKIERLTVQARRTFVDTITGKKHTYKLQFANPRVIDFRIQPRTMDKHQNLRPKKKLKAMLASETGEKSNQIEPAAATSSNSIDDGTPSNADT